MASFKIGREFFAKAKADYADWRWSWVREISQNSMDCGSNRIDVTIERDGANTQIAVSNDGQPMTQDILASISTTTFYPNVFVPHGFRIALILWLPCLVALVQRGTDPTNSSASIPNPLS